MVFSSLATRARSFATSRGADLLQERRQQEAADAPGHAEVAAKFGRREIQPAVDVDLLVHGGAVAAVGLRVQVRGRFHAAENLPCQLAAADRIEGDGRAGRCQRLRQILDEGRRR